MAELPPLTDERLWELWRQAENIHTVEVDLAFGRLVAEEAVKQERAMCIAAIKDVPIDHVFVNTIEACAAAIRARSSQVEQGSKR